MTDERRHAPSLGIEMDDDTATFVINRPDRRNAVKDALIAGF